MRKKGGKKGKSLSILNQNATKMFGEILFLRAFIDIYFIATQIRKYDSIEFIISIKRRFTFHRYLRYIDLPCQNSVNKS